MNDVTSHEEFSDTIHQIIKIYGANVAIILIGSAARGKRDANSDIDFLVVGYTTPKREIGLPGFHIQMESQSDFLANLCKGEDFEAWCIRYGRSLHDSRLWTELIASECANVWPKWEIKVIHGARRVILASELLEVGDKDASREELLYALGHVARAILLKAGVFPLSRPELAEQVRALGYRHLARLHDLLRHEEPASISLLRQAQLYSKKLLCHLDSESYKRASDEFRRKKRAKQRHAN